MGKSLTHIKMTNQLESIKAPHAENKVLTIAINLKQIKSLAFNLHNRRWASCLLQQMKPLHAERTGSVCANIDKKFYFYIY